MQGCVIIAPPFFVQIFLIFMYGFNHLSGKKFISDKIRQRPIKTRFNLQICNISTLKNLVVFFIILNVINETGRRYDIDK